MDIDLESAIGKLYTGWRTRALCEGMNTDMFFETPGRKSAAAKEVCSDCPVKSEWLEYAMADATWCGHGIFGGLSRAERFRLATERTGLNGRERFQLARRQARQRRKAA